MVSQSHGKTLTLDRIRVQLESYQAFQQGKRIIVNQGGTRSGKTYGIVKLLIALAYKQKYSISITSLSFPHLRKGALRDWRTIMEAYDLYSVPEHVRTENTYYYPSGSYMEFFSVDDHLKVRGPGRDILFINEANLVDFDTFTQLLLRTKVCAFLDYNPADEFHWLYDKVLTRPDCAFIKSTYKDNPFLPKEQVSEIENLKNMDSNFWRIYGEGERGHSEGVIYTHWDTYSELRGGNVYYGLDFGFNHPCALVKVTDLDKHTYVEELIYQSGLTNPELISLIKQLAPNGVIYCDSARPDSIKELQLAGISARPADKDVKAGIMFLKSRPLHIHKSSANLLKEIKSYKFVDNQMKDLVPLKVNDDACFVGSTLITTKTGLKRIDQIIPMVDEVLTSEGYKLVLCLFDNGLKQVNEYLMHFDTLSVSLSCTEDHLIKTGEEWTQISKLKSGQMVSLSSFLTEENTSYNQSIGISNLINGVCIGTYGSSTTDQGPKDFMSITLTAIPGITGLRTLNSKRPTNTSANTPKNYIGKIQNGLRNFIERALPKPLNGTEARRGLNGIKNMLKNMDSDILTTEIDRAKYAGSYSGQELKGPNSVIKTAELKHLERGVSWKERVYDLCVYDKHEYFANGVLVHNCDAARYGTTAMRTVSKQSYPTLIR